MFALMYLLCVFVSLYYCFDIIHMLLTLLDFQREGLRPTASKTPQTLYIFQCYFVSILLEKNFNRAAKLVATLFDSEKYLISFVTSNRTCNWNNVVKNGGILNHGG